MKIPQPSQSHELRVNMTPMIDVVFLLIIFFLVSSHLARQESQFPIPLPEATSGEELDSTRERVIVNVLGDGSLLVGGRAVATPELLPHLRRETDQRGSTIEVRIRGDREVPFESVQPVLQAVAAAGIANVTFSVVQRK